MDYFSNLTGEESIYFCIRIPPTMKNKPRIVEARIFSPTIIEIKIRAKNGER